MNAPAAITTKRPKWSRGGLVGATVLGVLVVLAAVSFVWTPYDVVSGFSVSDRLAAPSSSHWLGTDQFGRDVLSQLMIGARTSLWVAMAALGIGMGIGVPLGLVAVAHAKQADTLIMRGSDLVFAFPALVLAIILTAILGSGLSNAIIAIGIFNIPVFARLTRGSALPVWQNDYIQSARLAGKSSSRIAFEHVLPNISSILGVHATIQFSLGILAEAGLSYVGLGAQPPLPSWGRMLAENQTLIAQAPWLVLFPGLAIFVTVLAVNLTGRGLRRRFGVTELRGLA